MPTPRDDETQDDFIARCVPIVLEDGTAENNEQAVAVCYSMWENRDQQGAEEPMSKTDYRDLPNFERKTIPTFIKDTNEKEGIVEHIVSVFGIRDMQGDRVMPGAYTKTIAERFGKIRTLDQHMADSALRVVGKPRAMREIGRNELPQEVLDEYPEATGGLLAVTQYAMKTDNGRDMFHLVDGGFLPETSIGYDPITAEYVEEEIDGQKVTTRLLKEIRLWEYSNVIWGANPATVTTGTKQDDPSAKADKQTAIDNLTAFLAEATLDQRADLWQAWQEHTQDKDADPPRYVGREDEPTIGGGGGGGIDEKGDDGPEEGKIGRAISAANARRIQGAIDAAQVALSDLESLLGETMPLDEPEEEDQVKDAPPSEAATGQETEAGPPEAPTSDVTEAEIDDWIKRAKTLSEEQ